MIKPLASALALSVCCALPSQASVIITAIETGDDVFFSFSGTINVSGQATFGTAGVSSAVDPSRSVINFNATGEFFELETAPTNFGSGSTNTGATNVLGDVFALTRANDVFYVGVETGFTSGSVSGSMTFENSSFSSLGMDLGTFVWTSINDTFTLNVGDQTAAIPLPASLPLMIAGLGLLGWRARRKS